MMSDSRLTALGVWDDIAKHRDEYKEYTLLVDKLALFGRQERRNELKYALDMIDTIIHNGKRADIETARLGNNADQLKKLLREISNAAKSAFEGKSDDQGVVDSSAKISELNDMVPSFGVRFARFNHAVLIQNTLANNKTLPNEDLSLVGSPSEIIKLKSSHDKYVTKGSYRYSNRNQSKPSQMKALVEKITYEAGPKNEVPSASVLQFADSHWNIPRLKGYRDENSGDKLLREFIFEDPHPETEPIPLDELYREKTQEPALNLRLGLCSQMAIAVLQAHLLGLVHKNIRPQNLLVSCKRDGEGNIEQASLILSGWVYSSLIEGMATEETSKSVVPEFIYKHPNCRPQGEMTKEDYNIGYDIYSMGVCMLELLTWDLLIQRGDNDTADPVLSDAYQHQFNSLKRNKGVDPSSNGNSNDPKDTKPSAITSYNENAKEVQDILIAMAGVCVEKTMCGSMASLIQRCLTYLDTDRSPFNVTKRDTTKANANDGTQDGEQSGVRDDPIRDRRVVAEYFRNEILEDFNKLLAVL
ncbi:hypothetical protein F4806DRAFT_505008 [Annulohypoxylon nitens]|nr:hypothetical protein F4806DRAFT_505008 [Annulohypoxylon nitens]